ncbi:MAG: phosphoesterase [Sphingobacteriales bacterium]|nr:MAG: phosphoesterase [Sphingobacteriales bacterium]
MKRSTFIKSLAGLAGAGLISGLYSWQIEPFWLEFVRLKMPVKNLPDELVGKTLMQISDMHVGDRFDWQFIIDSFEEAKAFEPDIVVYTGDFINKREDILETDALQTVFQHAVKGRLATVGVLGNHDYGRAWNEPGVATKVIDVLQKAGLKILRNESAAIIPGFNILGIDDYWATNFQPGLVMPFHQPGVANIVLCHNPDACDLDIWSGYKGWILAGHTHGGQVKPPFLPPPVLPVQNRKYTAGHIDLEGGRQLYINRALGHSYQVRFNVRPEITIFTLEKVV